ncbi:MAG: NAD(P)H-binding protein [Planctomycetota bacterium]|jgi:uncharacterized protein YbjT (DUF2867 family)
MLRNNPVLVAGATGFIGRHLCPSLKAAGFDVVGASRDPQRAASRNPDLRWVELDVDRPATMASALEGMASAVYLIHGMQAGGDYDVREAEAAIAFREAAATAGLRRIIYLGGVAPEGVPSKHLWSRLRTGELLREGPVPTIELRAGMVVGFGSLSWQIVRDLAARLPVMILPRWLKSRSQPIAVEDVIFAIRTALELEVDASACFDIPGPETLSGEDILKRIASLLGIRPLTIRVPVITPKLSSYWLRFVTRADFHVAQELVEGLKTDLLATGPGLWAKVPEHQLVPFDQAARRALEAEAAKVSMGARMYESLVKRVAPRGHQEA